MALLILTMVRTGEGSINSLGAGGLITLEERDTLIAFQDFSFDTDGWDRAIQENSLPGLGPVLDGSVDTAVERVFALPEETALATIRFDMFLNGGWGREDTIHIILGEIQTLALGWPSDNSELVTFARDGLSVLAQSALLDPIRDNHRVARYSVELAVSFPADRLTLRLVPELVDGAQSNWAIDNVSVVARGPEA
ncbi:hypothetical protein V8J82_09280 [Gymnodinialimonas sp. 2305UL16-5]|uniref:hypothetical protein n=1 Tax=Gymnodinialimonas mytili TaxID=3126503 RepID=UPI0030AF30FD